MTNIAKPLRKFPEKRLAFAEHDEVCFCASMNEELPSTKLKGAMSRGGSSASKYFKLMYGPVSTAAALWQEAVMSVLGSWPGAAGIALRGIFYKPFFAGFGKKVLIGRNVVFRHACKISIGDGVVIDEGAMVDAKGDGNDGIKLDDGVYVGRRSIVYCKGGSMHFRKGANIGANCTMFSSNMLTVGEGVMIGAYSYFLSGGEYDPDSAVPFAEQNGMVTRGPLEIGDNCWIGARVTVLDAANIGAHSVVGAGAVVTKPVPGDSLILGVPARVIRPLAASEIK